MSDNPETPVDGSIDNGQGPVDTSSAPTPPWGDDFQPEKAWSTIQAQRASEAQLKEELKQLHALRDDPDEFTRFAAEHHGFEVENDIPEFDEVPLDENGDPLATEVAELRAWQKQQQDAQVENAIASHVGELTAETDLTLEEKQWIFEQAKAPGFNEKRTEKLVNQYLERSKAREEAAVEKYRKSKRAPSPPQPGTAGEAKFDHKDPKARVAHMAAQLAAAEGD